LQTLSNIPFSRRVLKLQELAGLAHLDGPRKRKSLPRIGPNIFSSTNITTMAVRHQEEQVGIGQPKKKQRRRRRT
jgi:hypothetical protein